MTIKIEKSEIDVRAKLNEASKPTGVAGNAMLRADTPQEQFRMIGAGRRNLIINGAFQVAQRGTSITEGGANVNAPSTTSYFALDRFKAAEHTDGSFTVAQKNDGPMTDDGRFRYYMEAEWTNPDTSVAGTQYAGFFYKLERGEVDQFNYGTTEAKTMTLSFYHAHSIPGHYSICVRNSGNGSNRNFVVDYYQDEADVWQKSTIVIPGDMKGQWNPAKDEDDAMSIMFTMANGTSYQESDYTKWRRWFTVAYRHSTHLQTQMCQTANSKFRITGVQLEAGSVATPFEHRSYGEELALCQRYLHVIGGSTDVIYLGTGSMYTTTNANLSIPLPATFRDNNPSLIKVPNSTGNWINVYIGATGTISNPTPLQGDFTQSNVRLYCINAHSGTGSSFVGASIWSMVLANAMLIIDCDF